MTSRGVAEEHSSGDTTTEDAADEGAIPARIEAKSPQFVSDDEWNAEPSNPLNWPMWRKMMLVSAAASMAFVVSAATSMLSPARAQLMEEFDVSSTVALLPVSLYVFAMGFGPIIGGPLSETIGRLPIYYLALPLGSLFTLGAGFTHDLGVLCFCRFMAGFCFAPVIAVPAASLTETFTPKNRGPASAVYILMPFLGPGLGPVMGSYLVSRKDWRWTEWTIIFLAIFCMMQVPFLGETFNPLLKRRLGKKRGYPMPPKTPLRVKLSMFVRVALIRPLYMVFTEPIVSFLCLYVAINFGVLFSFFAGVPYTFGRVYHFSLEQSGLVFLSIAIGCLLGFVTIIMLDALVYRRKTALYPPHKTPPEHRLYAAMVGSLGLPTGLFWYAWTARPEISWASPAVAMMPFAGGNLCVFVSAMQYMADTYSGAVIASAMSANALARYSFAGAFPLFTLQMYEKLGIDWTCSMLGFVSLALLPIPWILFKFGPRIRAKSRYETIDYTS